MTGYGRAEAALKNGTLTLEIRTLNAKGCEINIKTSLIPKEKELTVRQQIAERLQRGTIDLSASFETAPDACEKKLDRNLAIACFNQLAALGEELGVENARSTAFEATVRQPDLFPGSRQSQLITEEDWPLIETALKNCLDAVETYRKAEGKILCADVCKRIQTILETENEVEGFEAERIGNVRERILRNLEELQLKPDEGRLEQEMVYYLEKLDISEEKVRLRQNCNYFLETIESDPCPGKKLGFIIQEIGREINTTGSKANHASIQKCVVRMKDELEKIREQSMNIL